MRTRQNVGSMSVVDSLIEELEKGVSIIRRLGHGDFASAQNGASSIGAHIRHNLDFVNALVNGIAVRRVDYNARLRDPRVETDPQYAIQQMLFACRRLESLTPELLSTFVMVRSEIDADLWHASSVSREIEYLHSHAIHHYALIGRLIDSDVPSNFGVAPSTVRYRARQSAEQANLTAKLRNGDNYVINDSNH